MRVSLWATLLAATVAATANQAGATIINVDGAVTGCSTCNGSPHPAPGDTLGTFIDPVVQTFGPGTYKVTNAVGKKGALYDAWRFNGSESNWIWSVLIADADTHKVVLDSLVPSNGAFVGDHASVASAAYALNYSGTFTLNATTKLAFLTEDYYPYDNAGGVSIDVSPVTGGVPEPAQWALLIGGFGVAGAARRRARRSAAIA